nr:tripartite tricarboxylate transporter substrate binding protein [Halomonas socia]
MMITRTLILAVATSVATGAAHAQSADYSSVEVPSTVDVIVAASAGGSSDALVRVTMPYWEEVVEEMSGQSVSTVVRNLPGAGTEIGSTELATAEPSGQTIGLMNLPHIPLLQATRDVEFEPWLENFIPLGLNVVDANVIILGERSPYDTLAEALEAVKQQPGSVIVGAQGPLSDDQLALYGLQDVTGAEFTFTPYPGGSDANRALRNGEIDITVGNTFDYVQLEDVAKDAAIFQSERYEMIPDVPTVQESLGVEASDFAASRGFAAPYGLPEDLLALYRDAFEQVFNNPTYKEDARARNMTLVEPRIGEAFGEDMAEQDNNVNMLLQYFEEGGYLE